MKKNLFLTLLPFLLLLSTDILAQTKQPKPKSNGTTKPKQPSEKEVKKGQSDDVQVFDQKDGKGKDDYDYFEKKESTNPKNVFKISLFEAIDGTFPLLFERVIAPKFTAELGLGVTTSSSGYAEIRSILGGSEYDNFVKGQTGSFVRIGVRYYPSRSDYVPEGPYFALEFQMKQFKFDALKLDAQGSPIYSAPYQSTTITNYDLARFVFGYQVLTGSNFTWDSYIGLGWRQHTFNGWYKDETSGKAILGDNSSSYPTLMIGVKIGIGF